MRKFSNLVLIIATAIGIASCGHNAPQAQAQNYVTVSHAPAPQQVDIQSNDVPDFDIPAFAELLKTTANPDALTQAINAPGNVINHLNLDGDKDFDYVKVDQVNNTTLQVVDETQNGKTIIATLTINSGNNSYAIQGNQAYCGPTYAYQSPTGLSFGQLMFLSWWMRPHAIYHPYWGYHRGYYGGYHPYRYSPSYRTTYRTTHTTTTRNVTNVQPRQQVKAGAPSRQPQAAPTPARTSLSNATTSQGAFKRNEGNRFNNAPQNQPRPQQQVRPAPTQSRPAPTRSFSGGGSHSFGGSRKSGRR